MSLPLDLQLHFNPLSASDVPSLGPSAPFQPPFCVRCPLFRTFSPTLPLLPFPMSHSQHLQLHSTFYIAPVVPSTGPSASIYPLFRIRRPNCWDIGAIHAGRCWTHESPQGYPRPVCETLFISQISGREITLRHIPGCQTSTLIEPSLHQKLSSILAASAYGTPVTLAIW